MAETDDSLQFACSADLFDYLEPYDPYDDGANLGSASLSQEGLFDRSKANIKAAQITFGVESVEPSVANDEQLIDNVGAYVDPELYELLKQAMHLGRASVLSKLSSEKAEQTIVNLLLRHAEQDALHLKRFGALSLDHLVDNDWSATATALN